MPARISATSAAMSGRRASWLMRSLPRVSLTSSGIGASLLAQQRTVQCLAACSGPRATVLIALPGLFYAQFAQVGLKRNSTDLHPADHGGEGPVGQAAQHGRAAARGQPDQELRPRGGGLRLTNPIGTPPARNLPNCCAASPAPATRLSPAPLPQPSPLRQQCQRIHVLRPYHGKVPPIQRSSTSSAIRSRSSRVSATRVKISSRTERKKAASAAAPRSRSS